MNNTNTYAYMQAELNMMFMWMHANKGINIFGKRAISEMIK